jgi:hypothetical protein
MSATKNTLYLMIRCHLVPLLAHFPRSSLCGDRVRLQSYFCRGSVAGSLRVHDPSATSAV